MAKSRLTAPAGFEVGFPALGRAIYGVALFLIGLAVGVGATGGLDDWLAPALPPAFTAKFDGRGTEDAPSLATEAGRRTRLGLTARVNGLGAAWRGEPPRVEIAAGSGVWCEDWRERLPSDGDPARWPKLPSVQGIAIHNTGTPPGVRADVEAVANYFVRNLGWEHTGYHLHIDRDGRCQLALDFHYQGYHAFRWNRTFIAVLLEGSTQFTEPQLATYQTVVATLMTVFDVDDDWVLGRRDLTRLDRDATLRGSPPRHPNFHPDPCLDLSPCDWDIDKLGLAAYLAARRPSPTPTITPTATPTPTITPTPSPTPIAFATPTPVLVAPTPPAAIVGSWTGLPIYQAPDRGAGASVAGSATFYGAEFHGRTTASGVAFDNNSPFMAATYLVGPLVDGRPQPAWPYGSWLRVTNPESQQFVDVEIVDTGALRPPHVIDLSQTAFRLLAPLSQGRLDVTVTVMHTPPDNGAPDPCAYIPMSGFPVCYAFRDAYIGKQPEYGVPITRLVAQPDGDTYQLFERGVMRFTAAQGVVWEPYQ